MQNQQLLRMAERALRTRSVGAIAAMVAVGLILLGSWWLSERSGEAEPEARPTASEAAAPQGGAPPVTGTDPVSGLRYVAVEDLPPEASDTLALIDAGGPFPYDRDGITFNNREEILPAEPRGYYREYTVETPGLSHRGARRIVTGSGGEYYWTADHYDSFEVIVR